MGRCGWNNVTVLAWKLAGTLKPARGITLGTSNWRTVVCTAVGTPTCFCPFSAVGLLTPGSVCGTFGALKVSDPKLVAVLVAAEQTGRSTMYREGTGISFPVTVLPASGTPLAAEVATLLLTATTLPLRCPPTVEAHGCGVVALTCIIPTVLVTVWAVCSSMPDIRCAVVRSSVLASAFADVDCTDGCTAIGLIGIALVGAFFQLVSSKLGISAVASVLLMEGAMLLTSGLVVGEPPRLRHTHPSLTCKMCLQTVLSCEHIP